MNDMDKLTLELFTNKIQYKKYLSKIEPDNYNEMQEFREKCIEYKNEIMNKVEELLISDIFQVQDLFYRFTSNIIQEIEKEKEREKYISDEEREEADDDEILFPPDKMNNSKQEKEEEEKEEEEERNVLEKYSFWGKERVIQQNYNSDFISHYPTNTSVRRRYIGGRRNSILPKDS